MGLEKNNNSNHKATTPTRLTLTTPTISSAFSNPSPRSSQTITNTYTRVTSPNQRLLTALTPNGTTGTFSFALTLKPKTGSLRSSIQRVQALLASTWKSTKRYTTNYTHSVAKAPQLPISPKPLIVTVGPLLASS